MNCPMLPGAIGYPLLTLTTHFVLTLRPTWERTYWTHLGESILDTIASSLPACPPRCHEVQLNKVSSSQNQGALVQLQQYIGPEGTNKCEKANREQY